MPIATEIRAAAARVVMDPKSHRVALMNAIGEALGIPSGGWAHGISRLFDHGEVRLYWLLRKLAGRSSAENAARNLTRAIQFVNAEVMLTLITASREHGPAVNSDSDTTVNTFFQGGLDYLGAEMHISLGLPGSVTSQWVPRGWALNPESGSQVRPATIPARDQVLAYAAQISASFERRFKVYLRECLGSGATAALDRTPRAALLVWKAYSFLAPGGRAFRPNHTLSSQIGQSFGIRTCLQFLHQQADATLPLELIVTDPRLNGSEWIRIAKVRVVESLFLERVLATTREILSPVP